MKSKKIRYYKIMSSNLFMLIFNRHTKKKEGKRKFKDHSKLM
jgi:hypothetical protein